MSAKHLLSSDEVAEILGVATSTLAKWRQIGDPELPYVRINGRIRYRAKDVDDFLSDADEEADDDDDDDTDDSEDDDTEDTDDE